MSLIWLGPCRRSRRIRESSPTPRAGRPRGRRPALEQLEARALLSISSSFDPAAGRLTVTGDGANDTIVIGSDIAGNIRVNGRMVSTARLSTMRTLAVNAGAGHDIVNASGLLGYSGAVTIDGQLGDDTLVGGPGRMPGKCPFCLHHDNRRSTRECVPAGNRRPSGGCVAL